MADDGGISINNATAGGIQQRTQGDGDLISSALHTGRCGFRELSSGNECGCRKFWPAGALDRSSCACGHHACFHATDESALGQPGSSGDGQVLSSALAAQLAQLSKLLGSITPVAASGAEHGGNALAQRIESVALELPMLMDQSGTQASANTSYQPKVPSICLLPQAHESGNDENAPVADPSASIGQWLRQSALQPGQHLVRQHDAPTSIEYQEGMLPDFDFASPARMPSTAPGTEQAIHVSVPVRSAPLDVSHYHNIPGAEDLINSSTEMDTPSVGSRTPDYDIPAAIIRPSLGSVLSRGMPPPTGRPQARNSPHRAWAKTRSTSKEAADVEASMPELANRLRHVKSILDEHGLHIQGFQDRLDAMERASTISHGRDQDLVDKVELMESRIMDMEGRIEELRLSSGRASDRLSFLQQHDGYDLASQQSLTGDPNGIKVRMDALDERVSDLEQSAAPSLSRPLEVEVILLPWGQALRGLWGLPGAQPGLSRATTQESEDWMSLAQARASAYPTGAAPGWTNKAIHDWADDSEEWFVPRAFSDKSVIYARLKSRGLVKQVDFNRSSAREVQECIARAFSAILPRLEADGSSQSDHDCDSPYLGLMAPFIPLRKVHRSSELRFLSKAEMLTPVLWTADFLASAMMHASGVKRLFITHAEAYFQRSHPSTSWTWQRLRELPAEPCSSQDLETAWKHHTILDAQPARQPSVASQSMSPLERRSFAHDGLLTEDMDDVEIKSESQSGFESEALPSAEPFVPITPVTEHDLNFSDSHEMTELDAAAYWHGSQSDLDEPASTPHPESSQVAYWTGPGTPRYNLRQHKRTASNPLLPTSPFARTATRLSQQYKPKRITRSFSTPSNPLIASLPSFVPSSPNTARTRSAQRRRATTEQGSSGNKRRRVERSGSAGAGAVAATTHTTGRRQSRSASRSAQQTTVAGSGRGKRAMTPVGPYLTPYSGNFDEDEARAYGRDGARESDGNGEVWEGLGGLEADSDAASDGQFSD